jgi:hypothetical protein
MSSRATISLVAAALSAALLGTSAASAAPVNSAAIGKTASLEVMTTHEVVWRGGWRWRGGWGPGWHAWGWRARPGLVAAGVGAPAAYHYGYRNCGYTGDYCRWPGWIPPWYGYCSYGHSYVYGW